MVKRETIGNKEEIQAEKQDWNECKALINNLAEKSLADLQSWYNQHFSQLSQDEQGGLWLLVRVIWAIAKVLKKIWNIIKLA